MTVALVTGAAVRTGRATALALADEGMDLVVHYRRSEAEAAGLCQELQARGVRTWAMQADFEDPAACERLIERSRSRSRAPCGSRGAWRWRS